MSLSGNARKKKHTDIKKNNDPYYIILFYLKITIR